MAAPRSTSSFWQHDNVRIGAVYTLVSLAVVLPMLRPGFILTLDMVFTPHLAMPATVNNSYLFYALLHLLNIVLPGEIIQKILLFGIFLGAGVGLHLLARSLKTAVIGRSQQLGCYVAGIFYAINPFTYDRLMAGQYGVLLGYALLPFFVRQLLAMLQRPGWKNGLGTAIWAAVLGIVSIHALGFMLLLGLLGLICSVFRKSSDQLHKSALLKASAVALVAFLVLSSYWLVPLIAGKGSTANQLNQFSAQDSVAFATVGQNIVEKFANVIRLQGFWQEDRYLYALPQNIMRGWGLVAVAIWGIVGTGLVWSYRNRQRYLLAFFGGGILLGIPLACGALQPLAGHVGWLSGFREPQKFAALVALGYAIGLSWGVPLIIQTLQRKKHAYGYAGAVLVAATPFIFTAVLLWGAHNQLTPRRYPAEWTAVNQLLNKAPGTAVFVPWHLYMYYGFAGRIIASPAANFFDQPVLVSDDPEYKGAGAANTSPAKQAARKLLAEAPGQPDFARQLARQKISYIILASEDDYYNYDYLGQTSGLQKIYHQGSLTVYRNSLYPEARP